MQQQWAPPVAPPQQVVVPSDTDVKDTIDKMAKFVVKNGPAFEHMIRGKEAGNPKFAFLFGGPLNAYYQHMVVSAGGYSAPLNTAAPPPQQQSYGSMPPAFPQQPSPMYQQPPPQQQQQQQQQQQHPGTAGTALDFTPEKRAEFGDLLSALNASKDSIRAAKDWVMREGAAAGEAGSAGGGGGGLAHAIAMGIRHHISVVTTFQQKLHAIYLVNDVLFNAAKKESSIVEAWQPYLGEYSSTVPEYCTGVLYRGYR